VNVSDFFTNITMPGKLEAAMKRALGEKCEADIKSALKSEG